ncbi:Ctr copper transporter family-domain-containing protein [Hypoxylon sp. FL1284]|nr:Ctr copper transporter family-domain-containing protein [Hypoxylon sp. FL1284]
MTVPLAIPWTALGIFLNFAGRDSILGTMEMSNETSGMAIGEMKDTPMVMTFFVSSSTSLFSKAWTPTTTAAYAGTCVFLICLSTIMRGMLVLKPILEKSMWNTGVDSERLLVPDDEACCQKETLPHQSAKKVYDTIRRRCAVWRFRTSLSRAAFELLLATIGYLLMLAVMTMNVGYFLSVLGGLFLGTFLAGDLAADSSLYQDHHC